MARHSTSETLSLRFLLVALAALIVGGSGADRPVVLAQGSPCGPAINPVQCENQQPGSPQSEWDISGAGDPSIQGFATDISVDKSAAAPANRTVYFKINTDSANYGIDIYRLGYYSGQGARKVATIQPQAALPQSQPACLTEAATGLIDCGTWAVSASWLVPSDSVSGVYIARLRRFDTGGASHIIFIVRDDARQSNLLFQTSDTTWQAYNDYGGNSLYVGLANAPGINPPSYAPAAKRAYKVSYNRPFTTRAANPQSFVFNAEYPMLRWLEANGYDVKYWAGVDTDRRGGDLVGARKPNAFLSVGHDEYWSAIQRSNVESARGAGVNLAFFSGNEMYWKTRMESSIDGSATPSRTLVSYKETFANAKIDTSPDWTGTWRDPRFSPPSDGGRPENALSGTIWTVNCCSYAITVPAAMGKARFWRNTDIAALAPGTIATLPPETLGYEWDENLDNGSRPAGLTVLSLTTVGGISSKVFDYGTTFGTGTATHSLTLYRDPSGALVFGAGTVQWSWGLDAVHDRGGSHVPDQSMQQATVNLLADMQAQPSTLLAGLQGASASADVLPPTSSITSPAAGSGVGSATPITITGTATDTNGLVAGVEVSTDGGSTWHAAQGGSNWTYSWLPGDLGPVTLRSRAIDDSGNMETAGPGIGVTIGAGNCPCTSLWNAAATPATMDAGDGSPVELGVKFRSDIDTMVTAVRFYKGPNNTGTHVGNLWTGGGAKLATATFTNETSSGWQEVALSSPVAIAAGATYVVSYHTNVGHYPISGSYFDGSGKDAPPLHATSSTSVGGNGVFVYGTSAFPTSTYQGGNYWVDVVIAQNTVDTIPPVISEITATPLDSSTALVTWTTDEFASSRVDYSTDASFPVAATFSAASASLDPSHGITVTGLKPNTIYFYRVASADAAGNSTTSAPDTFTTLAATFRDTSIADFSAGTTAGTYVSDTVDGEVILAPAIGSEFSGTTLPTGWSSTPWGTGGSSAVVDGVLLVDGALVGSCLPVANACLEAPTLLPGHALEFMAAFTGDGYQHSGFGVDFGAPPWAMFSTKSGGRLWARTSVGVSSQETDLGNAFLGVPHRFRIDWGLTSVIYSVDGVQVASHALVLPGPMRPVAASDYSIFGGNVVIDWLRMDPYASTGSFVSRVFDAGAAVDWHTITWTANPASGTVTMKVRMGDSSSPDGSWTAFTPVAAPGPITGHSRYIQYRADFASSDPGSTPSLEDIVISADAAPIAVDDQAATPADTAYIFAASGPGSLVFNDIDGDPNTQLRVTAVGDPAHGSTTLSADGSVTYVPAAGYTGTDTFVYSVSDGLFESSANVTMSVAAANVPPVAVDDTFVVNQGGALTVPAGNGVLANDSSSNGHAMMATLMAPPSQGSLALNADGSFSYTPSPLFSGSDTFKYRASDKVNGMGSVAKATINILAVNHAPTFAKGANQTVLEDSGARTVTGWASAIDAGAPNESGQTLNFIVSNNNNALFSAQPAVAANGTLTFTPAANANGVATVTIQVHDNGGTANGGADTSALQTFTITVTAVNDSPAFAGGANQAVSATAGAQSVPGWAKTISAGPADEAGQTLTFMVSNNNNALFSAQPAIAANGTLTFTPLATASGTVTVSVQLKDNGGTANGGSDASAIQTFTIAITLVNNAPAFVKGANQTVLEDSGAQSVSGWATAISAGAASEAGQTLNFIVGNNNPGLFAVQPAISALGTLTYTPAATINGSASVTVQLHDNGGTANGGSDTSATQSFTITVTPVNDAPTFVKGADLTALSSAGAQTVTGWATAMRAGPADESSQLLNFIVSNNNTALFTQQPALSAGGTLTFTPSATASGSATVTVQLHDNGGTANGGADTSAAQTFTIAVSPLNHAPSFIAGASQTVLEDSGAKTVLNWATTLSAGLANESGQVLNFIVSNNNQALFSAQPAIGATGTLTFTPAANANGTATVTVQLHDNGGTVGGGIDTSTARTFTITVTPVNDAPAFAKGGDQVAANSAGTQTVPGWATAISAGPTDEASQLLNFIVSNSNVALFSMQPSVSAAGTLTFTPATGISGVATVTVQLHDNGGTVNGGADTSAAQTFTISVTGRDTTPPVLKLPANITTEATGPSGAVVTYSVSALDAVDGPSLVLCWPLPGMTFPVGTTTVTCLTSDRSLNLAAGSFTVTVKDRTAPTITSIRPSTTILSPPDHRMVPLSVSVAASDLVDSNPVCRITSVASNQAISGTGFGDLSPDWLITGRLTLSLRAERATSSSSGRTYTLTIGCTDASGNTANGTTTVVVPR